MSSQTIDTEGLSAREYMAAIGRAGGQKKSAKKTAAARKNAITRWRKARKIKPLARAKKKVKKGIAKRVGMAMMGAVGIDQRKQPKPLKQ